MKLWIQVKTNAKKEEVTPLPDGSLQVRVHAPPAEGRANEAVIRLLADHFKVPKKSVTLLVGTSSRRKLVEIN